MIVKVTQEHIRKGVRCDQWSCPIAHALNEQTGHPGWTVHNEFAQTNDLSVALPFGARVFVSSFDRNREVYPFEFELDLSAAEKEAGLPPKDP